MMVEKMKKMMMGLKVVVVVEMLLVLQDYLHVIYFLFHDVVIVQEN